MRWIKGGLWAAAILCPTAAGAQNPGGPSPGVQSPGAQSAGEITLYSEIGFRGQTYAMNGPRDFIRLGWQVRSAQVAGGETWRLCSGPRYGGRCWSLNRSTGNVLWTVASGRPEAPVARPTPLPAPIPPAGEASLKGMSSEFFRAPSERGGRVPSCASGAAGCAAESADAFCRARGWTRSAYQLQETVGGRIYLADVLCVRAF